MLNELYEISQNLDRLGLLQAASHPDIDYSADKDCLLIAIDRDGQPRDIKLWLKGKRSLWKHRKGNHNAFPSITVGKPLLAQAEREKLADIKWEKCNLKEKIALLRTLDFSAINPQAKSIKISPWSLGQLSPVLESDEPELAALKQLLSVFPHENQALAFAGQLAQCLQSKLMRSLSEGEVDAYKELLLGGNKEDVCRRLTYYDVYEDNQFDNLVHFSETEEALIRLLNDVEDDGLDPDDAFRSPLSGDRVRSVNEKYPNPNLKVIGPSYLYSKNIDIPCLERYRLTGVDAFRSGLKEVNAMTDALAFLTEKERRGKSWCEMMLANSRDPGLLLAYLSEDPANDAYVAEVLSDPIVNEDEPDEYELLEDVQRLFEKMCTEALNPLEAVAPQAKINLILLAKLDPGRQQIVYENNWSVERFRNNLLLWAEAYKNHPEMNLACNTKRKNKQRSLRPLSPATLFTLMKVHYTGDVLGQGKISALSLEDIYKLYMPQRPFDSRDYEFLESVLETTIRKSARLLRDVGHRQTIIKRFEVPEKPTEEEEAKWRCAFQFLCLMGILLHYRGVRKEKYMLNAPFQVGQMLQMADNLHKLYCQHVRNGGDEKKPLPPQLIGSELLSIACENPIEGLNRLRERLRIYLAWAKTNNLEANKLPGWYLERMAEASNRIAAVELPEQLTLPEQAQVFLGYLAKIKKNEGYKQNDQEGNHND